MKKVQVVYQVDMTGWSGTFSGTMPVVIIEMNTHGGIDKVTVEMAGREYPAYLWRSEEMETEAE